MKVFTPAGDEKGWAFPTGLHFPIDSSLCLELGVIFLSAVLETLLFTDLYKTSGEPRVRGKSSIRASFEMAHLLKKELL